MNKIYQETSYLFIELQYSYLMAYLYYHLFIFITQIISSFIDIFKMVWHHNLSYLINPKDYISIFTRERLNSLSLSLSFLII